MIILCVSVAIYACTSTGKGGETTVRAVKIDTVRIYGASQTSVYPGKVQAAADVSLAFRIAGPIAKTYADVGSYVRRGQTIAEMDSRDYELQLAATEAEYSRIKAEAERVIELYGKGSVAPNDYDKAVYGLQQITAKYDNHRNALADTRLTAPFDGYIQKLYFRAGETVGAGTPVVSMIDAGQPEVEINIPSSEYARRDRFDTFTCTVDIFPDRIFALDLTGIAPKANMNQLYAVRLKMRGGGQELPSPGMVTMVTIGYKPDESQPVAIPVSALFENDGQSAVWIYGAETETVTSRTVKVAEIHSDGMAIVAEGLSAGEIVVTAGVHKLYEGEKVRLLPSSTETNKGDLL